MYNANILCNDCYFFVIYSMFSESSVLESRLHFLFVGCSNNLASPYNHPKFLKGRIGLEYHGSSRDGMVDAELLGVQT